LDFFPKWKLEQRVLAYSILGGMPAYLRRFDDSRTLEDNLLREVLRPEGYLFEEVQFLLRHELTNPATYNSLLAAIARGATRLADIALDVGVDATTANKYLHVLRELDLVEREIPLSDPDPLRSRRGSYRIADRFLQFHFRHVQPNVSLIHAGRGARVLEEFIRPDVGRLVDEARLDFVLDHMRREAAELVGGEILEIGRYPGKVARAIGRTSSGATVVAMIMPEGKLPAATVEREIEEVRALYGKNLKRLVYGLTARVDRPLEVELVPEGELV
jgi:AAA+ ATPase superfamily predicted ATPase